MGDLLPNISSDEVAEKNLRALDDLIGSTISKLEGCIDEVKSPRDISNILKNLTDAYSKLNDIQQHKVALPEQSSQIFAKVTNLLSAAGPQPVISKVSNPIKLVKAGLISEAELADESGKEDGL